MLALEKLISFFQSIASNGSKIINKISDFLSNNFLSSFSRTISNRLFGLDWSLTSDDKIIVSIALLSIFLLLSSTVLYFLNHRLYFTKEKKMSSYYHFLAKANEILFSPYPTRNLQSYLAKKDQKENLIIETFYISFFLLIGLTIFLSINRIITER